jgi:hypothetical protein
MKAIANNIKPKTIKIAAKIKDCICPFSPLK